MSTHLYGGPASRQAFDVFHRPTRLLPPDPDPGPRLTLREWQVWHTYTSFFDAPLPALDAVARRLVRCGVAECAVTSDGAAWWATDDVHTGEEPGPPKRGDCRPVAGGAVDVQPDPDGVRSAVRLPPGVLEHPYAADGLLNWAWARHAERRLFGDGPLPPRYVWAQLGACTLKAVAPVARGLVVYPQLKVFETGVVLVHLRMLSPERPVGVDEFIAQFLNAGLGAYRWVDVPVGVAAWAPAAAPEPGVYRWYRRPWTAYRQWYHQRGVARAAGVDAGGDFAFRQVSLGLAQDAEVLRRAAEAVEPEIARTMRDALRAEAAARGVYLSPDLSTATVAPGVTVTLDGTPVDTPVGARVDVPAVAGEHRVDAGVADPEPGKPPDGTGKSPGVVAAAASGGGGEGAGTRFVDVAEITAAAERAVAPEARRLGRAVGEQAVYASGREPETFRGLALTIMVVAGTDRRGPRRGVALALLGPGPRRDVGAHWTGRPHAHLLRFAGQSASAAENAQRFAADLGAIVLRAAVADRALAARSLPPSTRSFDDHGAYLAPQGTLSVYTSGRRGPRVASASPNVRGADGGHASGSNGTPRVTFAPSPGPQWTSSPASAGVPATAPDPAPGLALDGVGPGRGDDVGSHVEHGIRIRPDAERALQVFEHQTKVEMLEYGYMLHRRIADRATASDGAGGLAGRAAPALLAAQRDLADFEWALQDTGRYGEVRDQLEAGLAAYGVPKLRERLGALLRVRQEAALYLGGVATARWAAFLALIAGVLAAPPLADGVVKPAWRLLRLPRPLGEDAFALARTVAALVLVAVVLGVGYAWTRRGRVTRRQGV